MKVFNTFIFVFDFSIRIDCKKSSSAVAFLGLAGEDFYGKELII